MKSLRSRGFGSLLLCLAILMFVSVSAKADSLDPNTFICSNCNQGYSGVGPNSAAGGVAAYCVDDNHNQTGQVAAEVSVYLGIPNAWYIATLSGQLYGSGVEEDGSAYDAYNGGYGAVTSWADCDGDSSGTVESTDDPNDLEVIGTGEYDGFI